MREHAGWSGFVDWDGIRRGFPLIMIAALVGPFLARTLYMYALRHLAVSRAALISQSQPLFVAIYSSILLHALPSRREWMGGLAHPGRRAPARAVEPRSFLVADPPRPR